MPGCREVVEDGYNGFLCEARSVESLAGALERMIRLSDEERALMRRNGRRVTEERFDVKRIISRYDRFLRRILGFTFKTREPLL